MTEIAQESTYLGLTMESWNPMDHEPEPASVSEDGLDSHMSAPIFAELQRESQHYLQDDEVEFEPSVWDRAEDVLDTQRTAYVVWLTALALGLTLGFIGWLALVSA